MTASQINLTRPPVRPWDVVTTLADFAIVTYAVEVAALARLLPLGVTPDVRTLDDGREVAMVSAVPFRDLDFRFGIAPWWRFRMGQTNYRAYVLVNGQPCVWFFGTSLTRPFVSLPRKLWRLPWHAAYMHFDVRWEGDELAQYSFHTESPWAPCELELTNSPDAMGRLDGFASEAETLHILTHPFIGHYHRLDGARGTYSVWHAPLSLKRAVVQHARFALFETLGLTVPGQVPVSALVQRETEFVIQLPPQRYPAHGAVC